MPLPIEGETPREERIAKGRRVAAEREPERKEDQPSAAVRVRNLRPGELRTRVRTLEGDGTLQYIGPDKSPGAWDDARRACRDYVIDAARRGKPVVYDELRVLTFEVTGMLLGHSLFARMGEEINEDSDGCLLSSWVVTQEAGRPGDGFFDFARSKGFDLPLETLQRQVQEHFGS